MKNDFSLPLKISFILQEYKGLWMIAGGWAIDLYLGKVTRKHKDIEIAIPRNEQQQLKEYLTNWSFDYVENSRFTPWEKNVHLSLPIHEIHAKNDTYQLEILLNEIDNNEWTFRRNKDIKYPLKKLMKQTAHRIPFLSPEIVLLYKAKINQEKDRLDFKNTFPLLSKETQDWLLLSIEKTHHNHDWLNF